MIYYTTKVLYSSNFGHITVLLFVLYRYYFLQSIMNTDKKAEKTQYWIRRFYLGHSFHFELFLCSYS